MDSFVVLQLNFCDFHTLAIFGLETFIRIKEFIQSETELNPSFSHWRPASEYIVINCSAKSNSSCWLSTFQITSSLFGNQESKIQDLAVFNWEISFKWPLSALHSEEASIKYQEIQDSHLPCLDRDVQSILQHLLSGDVPDTLCDRK